MPWSTTLAIFGRMLKCGKFASTFMVTISVQCRKRSKHRSPNYRGAVNSNTGAAFEMERQLPPREVEFQGTISHFIHYSVWKFTCFTFFFFTSVSFFHSVFHFFTRFFVFCSIVFSFFHLPFHFFHFCAKKLSEKKVKKARKNREKVAYFSVCCFRALFTHVFTRFFICYIQLFFHFFTRLFIFSLLCEKVEWKKSENFAQTNREKVAYFSVCCFRALFKFTQTFCYKGALGSQERPNRDGWTPSYGWAEVPPMELWDPEPWHFLPEPSAGFSKGREPKYRWTNSSFLACMYNIVNGKCFEHLTLKCIYINPANIPGCTRTSWEITRAGQASWDSGSGISKREGKAGSDCPGSCKWYHWRSTWCQSCQRARNPRYSRRWFSTIWGRVPWQPTRSLG